MNQENRFFWNDTSNLREESANRLWDSLTNVGMLTDEQIQKIIRLHKEDLQALGILLNEIKN